MYVFIVVALCAASIGFYISTTATSQNTPVVITPQPVEIMCTADATQCPDGSYVGRTGPDCSFVCPTTIPEKRVNLDNPLSDSVVVSPLLLSGSAAGWYFEGSFTVELVDSSGNIIAQGPATAIGDWMTTDFVPFTANLTFTNPYTAGDPESEKVGKIILRKDNPSGLPENDDFLEIPVRFAL